MKLPTPPSRRRPARAFTMIEMLVVFGIIAVLVGLIVVGAGHAQLKARISLAQTELGNLTAAIDSYKNKLGSYPPDNIYGPAQPPLFYELTGMLITQTDSSGAPTQYHSPVSGDTFSTLNNDFLNVFGPTNGPTNGSVVGFANATSDPTQVQNFMPANMKNGLTGKLSSPMGSVANTFFGVQVDGPLKVTTLDGKVMSPWSYVLQNRVHNPDSYDLWVDITGGGKTYRISNWTKDPQPL